MPQANLNRILTALQADPGLRANVSARDTREGLEATRLLNRVLLDMIAQTGANRDRLITAEDMQAISDTLWLRRNAAPWRDFWLGHGDDEGAQETGFHLFQNDGSSLQFMGRNFADTVADGIFHYGFRIQNGRYYNEDGNDNEEVADVAGWLNFFLNGRTVVYGTAGNDRMGSGTYSAHFAAARSELFRAGAGNDEVWADDGNDRVLLGKGHDTAGGGAGNDRIFGEAGNDRIYGDEGGDRILGGGGNDSLGGGDGNDRLFGGAGDDQIGGDDGADRLQGGAGADTIYGGDGGDRLNGDAGADSLHGGDDADRILGGDGADDLSGGEGADVIRGGRGADTIHLWENAAAADRIVFAPGDSGRQAGSIDRIEGFDSGQDKIDLSAFGAMRFATLDFIGNGRASAYYDGTFLRVDGDGDGATDMMVEFAWVDSLRASDFIFG